MKHLLVSLHDVAPPFERDILDQLDELERIGQFPVSLKVVPNWHGVHPLSESPRLLTSVKAWHNAGSEIVLHGNEHRRQGAWRGSPIRRARAGLFAPDAAEFMSMDGIQAMKSVESALDELEKCGLSRPTSFSAPGWLLSDEAQNAIAESGFQYLIGMQSILDLKCGSLLWTPSAGFMGGGSLHEAGIAALGSLTHPLVQRLGVIKVYLHPDVSGRRRWLRTVMQIDRLLRDGWTATTFAALMNESAR